MVSPLLKALEQGFSADQILQFIIKKFPNQAGKITSAITSGFSADQIVQFLSGGKKIEETPVQATTEFEKTRATDISQTQERNQSAIQAGTLAATSLAAPAAISALKRALPTSLSGLAQHILPQQLPNQQSQQPPINVPDTIPNQPSLKQPEVKSIDTSEILTKHNSKDKVDKLIESGNDATGVMGFFRKFYPQVEKDISKEAGKPFEEVVKDYIEKNPKKSEESTEKLKKSDIAFTPSGAGEVIAERNGKVLLNVDGKRHEVEEKKLLKPPKEAAIEALELIKSFTPEAMRSTHHMLNAYDESERKGFFVFHNGSSYIVDDISPEEYKELSEEIEHAKTTGETIIGKWAAGEGSRGAAYNKFIKGVRDRKVVPSLKKKFRKLKVGYNLLSEWQRLLNEK